MENFLWFFFGVSVFFGLVLWIFVKGGKEE
jgi:hypothetical protein